MNDWEPLITPEELHAFAGSGPAERMKLLVELTERAYERGWAECDRQWSEHVLEIPAAQA